MIKHQFQVDLEYPSLSGKFQEAIIKIYEKHKKHNEKVVVLIDEYDKAVLKDVDSYLKLVFLSMVTGYSWLGEKVYNP